MKVPPKRKGNTATPTSLTLRTSPLNESPSEKEGKCHSRQALGRGLCALNESPSEKEGKFDAAAVIVNLMAPQ